MEEKIKKILALFQNSDGEVVFKSQQEVLDAIKELDALSKEEPAAFERYSTELQDVFAKLAESPQFQSHRFKQELANAVEDGAELWSSIRDIGISRGQIREADAALEGLRQPAIPSAQPKSVELQAATEDARRRAAGTPVELDPILQRNLEMLDKNLNVAQTASAGQGSIYGSLGQNAINQARRANIDMIPQVEQMKRADRGRYDNLIRTGIQEDQTRQRQMQNIYREANNQYLAQVQAAGQLGAAGRENLSVAGRNLAGQLPGVAPLAANLTGRIRGAYDTWRDNRSRRQYTALDSVDPTAGDYGNRINDNLEGVFRDGVFSFGEPLRYRY